MSRLIRNAAQCNYCEQVIESKHRHDFRTCKCGRTSVDGGLSYARRLFEPKLPVDPVKDSQPGFTELSEYAEDEELFDVREQDCAA